MSAYTYVCLALYTTRGGGAAQNTNGRRTAYLEKSLEVQLLF